MGKKFSALLASASTLSLIGHGAVAQETETSDQIVVTGSRIPQDPNLTSSVPVQSIGEEDIKLSGEINLADVVNDIPALISSLTSENSTTGANSLNLRGLGGERTLTLVNGRRHVAGFRGTQAVDIGSIPRALVKSVEVTTGGASAVYGADAVTGVVNFILKDDFEGFELTSTAGTSSRLDAETFTIDAIVGKNFANDRGNAVFTASFTDDTGLTYGDRTWSANNGISTTQTNPDSLTDPDAPSRAVIDDPRFWLTSQEGSIAPTFGGRSTTYVDINGNGIADCQESEGGRVGYLAGCWLTEADGSVSVNQDGTVLGNLWGIGGDGGRLNFNRDTLFPETDKYALNFNTSFDVTPNVKLFFEAKYVNAESTTFGELDTFYDTLFILSDNPYIPAELDPVVDVTGGLLLTQDPLDFSDNNPTTNERETTRFVGGIEWALDSGHTFEFSVNHGAFKNTTNSSGLYLDRIFAAIDAVEDGDGNIVCRSDLDSTASYEIDYFAGGNGFANGAYASNRYYSFTPGDGQCAPLNPFGTYSASAAAQNFVTSQLEDVLELEQTVVSALATGQFDVLQSFLAGPIGYAAGAEYREETSENKLDPLTLGILPEGTSFTPGVQVNEVDDFLFSFTSIDNDQQFNTSGSYEVTDVFAEVRIPLIADKPLFEELTVDGAVRFADYSTIGEATTWKVGATWAPVSSLSFRATMSEAVRAPNISELFDPPLPITIAATADPCDPNNVNDGSEYRLQNCIASVGSAGVASDDIVDGTGAYVWTNPLTGRFSGVSGGNENLDAETAETFTAGVVFQPSFIDGLSITVDYWDITIEDAISSVSSTDILEGCLDSASYPGVPFCDQFTRRADGGLDFLESGQINFAQLEATGVDFAADYSFDMGQNTFGARLVGSYQEKLDRFFNPLDLTEVDPEVGEINLPEWSGNLVLSLDRGPLNVGLQTSYQGEQSVAEIEDLDLYGDDGTFDETYIFDANMSYEFGESFSAFGGVNNILDEEPFSTQTAWPVGPRGRFFFVGLTYTH